MAEPLNLSDPRGPQGDRRSAHAPFGNGKARIAYVLLGGVVTLGTSIGAAQWTASIESERTRRDAMQASDKAIAVIEERQRNQYQEVIRQIEQLREDLREGRLRR